MSRDIAEILRQWIPGVIQAAKPYYSPDDITKGTRWNSEISKELDASKVGIICLTKDNLNSPWIMFEAGALSKNLEKSKVCPILFGIEPSDIKGPLIQFQASKFSKKEIKRVTKMINEELSDSSLSNDVLENVFDMWWPRLEEQINGALEKARTVKDKDLRSERDLLEEILSLSRSLSISRKRRNDDFIHPGAIEDIIDTIENLTNLATEQSNSVILDSLEKFRPPLDYIIDRLEEFVGSRRTNLIREKWSNIEFERFTSNKRNIFRKSPLPPPPSTKNN
ncbi:TIR domain-containing protein [Zunongwangia endophytica]|uniref:TIR domain-containing protein n=1 Tax=Zunongwangia endophytica TaxID=1808945 RepID=A0ABV8H8B0_9FLAO|nr:TIR domain-containing protein [Zunongwangia endophytica]MDN3593486.1 TIR domain-containing protein [Zunongwangia endophytica]